MPAAGAAARGGGPASRRDAAWLKAQLHAALPWDTDMVDSVGDLIASAATPAEVADLTAAYIEDCPAAVAAINEFMAARSSQQQQQQWAAQPAPGSSYSASLAAPPPPPQPTPAQRAAAAQAEQDKWLRLGAPQPAPEAAEPSAQPGAKQEAEATLAMFKRGRTPRGPKPAAAGDGGAAAGGGGGGGGGGAKRSGKKGEQLDQLAAKLERKVANCLSCGKIFDCRSISNDIIRFIDSGFKCTFCGTQVAMTQAQRVAQAQAPGAPGGAQQQAPGSSSGGAAAAAAEAAAADAAKAVAFKDRLVEYDRNSQQRTTVIDDQSDFFEIDTNAWLSDEERAELRRRAELEEAALAARRNKVTVTLDLLGRKVLRAEAPDADGAAAGGGQGASFDLGGASATQQLLQQAAAAAAAGGGGGQAAAQAGGSAGQLTAQQALGQALAAVRDLRISTNPSISSPPVFLPRRQQADGQQQPSKQQPGKQQPGKQPPGKQQRSKQQPGKQEKQPPPQAAAAAPARRPRAGAAASRAAAADSRVQDDSVFDALEAELLADEVLGFAARQPAAASALPART